MSIKDNLENLDAMTATCLAVLTFFLHFLFYYFLTEGAGVHFPSPEDSSWFEFLGTVGLHSIPFGIAYIIVYAVLSSTFNAGTSTEDDND